MSGLLFGLFMLERRLENFRRLNFFLEDFLLCEPLGVVGRQLDKVSEDPSDLSTTRVSGGPSSSSLLSSVLFREKIPNRFLNKDGFLIFLDFLVGFSGSSKIVSGSFVSESTAEKGPTSLSGKPSIKWREGSLECRLCFLWTVTHFSFRWDCFSPSVPSLRLRLRLMYTSSRRIVSLWGTRISWPLLGRWVCVSVSIGV